jgi:aminopeptidase N
MTRHPNSTRLLARAVGLVAALLIAPDGVIADTYPRQQGVDALHYAFRLTLNDDNNEIAGEAAIELGFTRDGLSEATLDLASAAAGKGMTVTGVACAGEPVRFEHKENRLRIFLQSAPKAGDRRVFVVSYHGVPAAGLRIGANRQRERTFFSENWPDNARQWLPMIDHPYDKATSEFLITAPARYQVVANGLLQEERDLGDGRRLTHWKQSVPISSWLNAVGAAQFSSHYAGIVKGVSLQTWVFHQERDAGLKAFEGASRRVLEFYSEHIGPYPYEKLASVQAAGLNGGTEHASAIFYGEASVNGREATDLVAHEIAHQWFGDSVTERDWDDVWLSEGFATYFTLLFTEHDRGRDAFVRGLKRSRDTVFVTESRNPKLAVVHDNISDTRKVLNALVYQKGGWTLHMLRGQVGDDKFWEGIREYYSRYRDRNATTEDFRRVMEEVSGKELSTFFDQWLKRAGSPVVEGTWTYDSESHQIKVEMTQTQSGEAYRLPIELEVTLGESAAPRVQKIELAQKSQTFEINADRAPSSVVLDPNCWVLMKSKFQHGEVKP